MTSINDNNTPPLHTPPHTPRRRCDNESSRSPKRARRQSPPLVLAEPLRSCLLARPPADVAELRARIARRAADFAGLERCPWVQTAHAMQVAADAGAADPVGATNHAVRWLIAAGNPFWFTVGLRGAVAGHRNALAHELIGDASLWRPDLLLTECAPCGGGLARCSGGSSSSSSGNASALRQLRRSTAAARARAAVWGPFSAGFYCGSDDEDAEEQEKKKQSEEETKRPAARCFHDDVAHVPSVLMLDAALHGNAVAAGYIARAFAPHTWRLEGSWTVPATAAEQDHRSSSSSDDDEEEEGDAVFVPTTVIMLGRRTVRATAAVPARSPAALSRRVRAALRAMQQTLLPRLCERDEALPPPQQLPPRSTV